MNAQATQHPTELGDFTATPRILFISAMAVLIGLIASCVAWILLKLIGFFTNLFYFGRFDFALTSPASNHLGALAILVPVVGALIIGFMARYGSEKIRGHGIPEAIESILMSGSRVSPRLAVLKPVSAAISIGSGGPFGAEGPIIMTGGAFGSLIAQFFHLTNTERKTLLVAGAAAGMSAVFATPLAAVLLAVELLLFEWKPRSVVPVALSSIAAGVARCYILGLGPLFPVPAHSYFIGAGGMLGCVLVGVLAGVWSALMTQGVYTAEDLFHKLPIHWMWWPAIGAIFVGIGGLIFPPALGVGYDTIGVLLKGNVALHLILGVLIVKTLIWILALGSGTSGGVVAPVLMTGAALGALESLFLPNYGHGFWELVSMGATLAGTMACPFTGVVFAVELTHDLNMLLPLVVTCFLSYTVVVLVLKRSILTEKIARRGYHLSREYSLDPLEILFAREVMQPVSEPLVIAANEPAVAYAKDPLRVVVHRMVDLGVTTLPVIASHADRHVLGDVSLDDLLQARVRHLQEENERARVFGFRRQSATALANRTRAKHPSPALEEEDETKVAQ
jgi:chloride channel protein, CIC family